MFTSKFAFAALAAVLLLALAVEPAEARKPKSPKPPHPPSPPPVPQGAFNCVSQAWFQGKFDQNVYLAKKKFDVINLVDIEAFVATVPNAKSYIVKTDGKVTVYGANKISIRKLYGSVAFACVAK